MKFIVLVIAVSGVVAGDYPPLSDEFIAEVNRAATTWKAGRNFHRDTPLEYLRGLMGTLVTKNNSLSVLKIEDLDLVDLPTEFDARNQWPHCPSLSEIRDQSACGSCWAVSAAEIMTDRQCIHKDGQQFHYSAEDLISCCTTCGYGCFGGHSLSAMEYWMHKGIVSGGPYNSFHGCLPYPFPKCEHHSLPNLDGAIPSCKTYHFNTPKCQNKCEKEYPTKYEDDKHFARKVYEIRDEVTIMQEILKNGPVQASFIAYADFISYKTGVYKHVRGMELGGHSARMLGWGEENGVKYWLMANCWNAGWGNNGYFKILRGEDECGIEDTIVAGIPK